MNSSFSILDWAMVIFILFIVISSIAGYIYYVFIEKEEK